MVASNTETGNAEIRPESAASRSSTDSGTSALSGSSTESETSETPTAEISDVDRRKRRTQRRLEEDKRNEDFGSRLQRAGSALLRLEEKFDAKLAETELVAEKARKESMVSANTTDAQSVAGRSDVSAATGKSVPAENLSVPQMAPKRLSDSSSDSESEKESVGVISPQETKGNAESLAAVDRQWSESSTESESDTESKATNKSVEEDSKVSSKSSDASTVSNKSEEQSKKEEPKVEVDEQNAEPPEVTARRRSSAGNPRKNLSSN